MVSGKRSTGWDGKPFWGLVVQQGPWKSTPADVARAKEKDNPSIGGGIPFGGRAHAGAANFKSVMTPYQINASGPPPKPSAHATSSVMMGVVDMKRQGTRGGRVKKYLTLGARTPMQTGHKMGGAPEEMVPVEPGEVLDQQPAMPGAPFMPEHHIEEVGSYGTVSALPYTAPIQQYQGIPEYVSPVYDQIQKALEASTNVMEKERKNVMIERAKRLIRKGIQQAEAGQYLEQAREELGATTSVPVTPSFRYKKAFEPKLKTIKEVRTAREQGGPAYRPLRPEMRGVPGTSPLTERFYTMDIPSQTPAKRSKKKVEKDKRIKLAPLEKIRGRDVQIKLRLGERTEKKRSSGFAQRTQNSGKKLKLAPFEK